MHAMDGVLFLDCRVSIEGRVKSGLLAGAVRLPPAELGITGIELG